MGLRDRDGLGRRVAIRIAANRVADEQNLSRRERRALRRLANEPDVQDSLFAAAEAKGYEFPALEDDGTAPKDGSRFAAWIDAIIKLVKELLPLLMDLIERLGPMLGGVAASSAEVSREPEPNACGSAGVIHRGYQLSAAEPRGELFSVASPFPLDAIPSLLRTLANAAEQED